MADLRTDFLGVKSPNPFWLASAPPTDRKVNVERAFRAGWGGVVWKTLGEAGPPIVNVSGARYGAIHGPDRRLIAMNNIELITDRDLEINLIEIKEVKRAWPDRALIVSLMVPCDEESWKAILARVEETECDGVELNFGCPHGMSERGMGSAVGQVPEYVEMVTRWCKAHSRMPVIVKLTPNITDVRQPARAAKKGGADCGVAHQHHQLDHEHRSRPHDARTSRSTARARMAACAAPRSSRSRFRWCRRSPAIPPARAFRSRPSAESRLGATRRSSSRSAPERCRSAPPR